MGDNDARAFDGAVPLVKLLGKALSNPGNEEVRTKLREIVRGWGLIAGPAAHGSAPYDLAGGALLVRAGSPHAAQMINNMKGGIRRALKSRWGLEIEDVRVTLGSTPPGRRRTAAARRGRAGVEPREEDVRAFREECPEDMPEELADAISRFRAFFVRRFPDANR